MIKKVMLIIVVFLLTSGCSLSQSDKNRESVVDNFSNEDLVSEPVLEKTQVSVPDIVINSDRILDLSYQGLANINSSVFDKTNLEELNLSYNTLTGALPSQIGKLKNLKVLNASNNNMTGVPAEVGQLSNLEVLDLSNNQLTGLPNELANLKNLKTLNLSGNDYSEQDLQVIQKSLPNVQYILK